MFVIGSVNRINAAKDHRMDFLETSERSRGMARVSNRIAHLDLQRTFDVGREIAGLADLQFLAHVRLGIEAANFLDVDVLARVQQLYRDARSEFAIEDADVGNDAFVSIKIRIEGERLH